MAIYFCRIIVTRNIKTLKRMFLVNMVKLLSRFDKVRMRVLFKLHVNRSFFLSCEVKQQDKGEAGNHWREETYLRQWNKHCVEKFYEIERKLHVFYAILLLLVWGIIREVYCSIFLKYFGPPTQLQYSPKEQITDNSYSYLHSLFLPDSIKCFLYVQYRTSISVSTIFSFFVLIFNFFFLLFLP